MFEKLIGLATLPIDMVIDTITLCDATERCRTKEKLDYLTGKEEFRREQARKDAETITKIIKELKEN